MTWRAVGSTIWALRRLAPLAILLVLLAAVPAAAQAKPDRRAPTKRLLDVWLDIQLVGMMYPDTTPATLGRNLQRVAAKLGQPPLMIRHGVGPKDTLRFPARAVLIKPRTPATILVMYARGTNGAIYRLTDVRGKLKVVRVEPAAADTGYSA